MGRRPTIQWAYAYPQWNPDGQTLTYHTQLPGEAMHIYVATVGRQRHPMRSVPSRREGGWPVWSPDGSRIAYIGASPADNGWLIATMDPDGSHVSGPGPSSTRAATAHFKWSPDGTKVIAYQDPAADQPDTGGSLMIVDVGREGARPEHPDHRHHEPGDELAAARPVDSHPEAVLLASDPMRDRSPPSGGGRRASCPGAQFPESARRMIGRHAPAR